MNQSAQRVLLTRRERMFLAYWMERAVEEEREDREVGAIADLHRRLARSVSQRARRGPVRRRNRRVNLAAADSRRSNRQPYGVPSDSANGLVQDLQFA
jgi:hypothetical protein